MTWIFFIFILFSTSDGHLHSNISYAGCFEYNVGPSDAKQSVITDDKGKNSSVFDNFHDCINACLKQNSTFAEWSLFNSLSSIPICSCNNFLNYSLARSHACLPGCGHGLRRRSLTPDIWCGILTKKTVAVYKLIKSVSIQRSTPSMNVLRVTTTSTDRLSIAWKKRKPENETYFILIETRLLNSFRGFNSSSDDVKQIKLSGDSSSTTILGLYPGSLYRIKINFVSFDENILSSPVVGKFWTKIGDPPAPPVPEIIRRDPFGLIYVKLTASVPNKNGPISGYRIVVVDQTYPSFFDTNNLFDWSTAQKMGLQYWITAELRANFFDHKTVREFVVGDKKLYGKFLNFGPLHPNTDYIVTAGTVSTLNNITKITYASITGYYRHNHDHTVHFNFSGSKDVKNLRRHQLIVKRISISNGLMIGLSVAASLFGFFLILSLIVYMLLRKKSRLIFCLIKFFAFRENSHEDIQELTPTTTKIEETITELPLSDVLFEKVISQAWKIPSKCLQIDESSSASSGGAGGGDEVDKGNNFVIMSNVKHATLNKRGIFLPVAVHVLPPTDDNVSLFGRASDLDFLLKCDNHPNIIQLLGLMLEESGSIVSTVIIEESGGNLKDVLLESRALERSPVYAEKTARYSSINETTLLSIMTGIAKGMDHLSRNGIIHSRLCARHVSLTSASTPKIMGFTQFTIGSNVTGLSPGFVVDVTRWLAPEVMTGPSRWQQSSMYSKSDVWSFGVLLWEVCTLGATPFMGLSAVDVLHRVGRRGFRLMQPGHLVPDEAYRIIMSCCQAISQDRPQFDELAAFMKFHSDNFVIFNYNKSFYSATTDTGFQYQPYDPLLETVKMKE